MSNAFKIFISSTYYDLLPYRKCVLDSLKRLAESFAVSMEAFSASDTDPLHLSLEELDQCQVCLFILGHRYGHIPEGKTKSISHLEFEYAMSKQQRGDMRVFTFLASEQAAPLSPDQIEDDETRKRLKVFREQIVKDCTVLFFDDSSDLAIKVVTTVRNEIPKLPVIQRPRIFDEEQAQAIFRNSDSGSLSRKAIVDNLIHSMAQRFEPLFRLITDSLTIDQHPFFCDVVQQLTPIVPGIVVNEETGVLERAGIPHAVLRTETLKELIKPLNVSELFDSGLSIGSKAAEVLVAQILKDREVPESPKALIALWRYWDSTGGWGKLFICEETYDSPDDAPPAWSLAVKNSFLRGAQDESDQGERNVAFWRGYIKGFLNKALPAISRMMSALPAQQRVKVQMPAFSRVEDVAHELINDVDHFTIRFREEELSKSLLWLARADVRNEQKDYERAVTCSRNAIIALSDIRPNFLDDFKRIGEAVGYSNTTRLTQDDEKLIDKLRSAAPLDKLENAEGSIRVYQLCASVVQVLVNDYSNIG